MTPRTVRIAIANHGLFPFMIGGMERHTHFLAKHLAELGVSIDVIVPTLSGEQFRKFQELNNPYSLVQCDWPPSRLWLRSNYLFSRGVSRHLVSQRYDAVYGQGFNAWHYLTHVPKAERSLTWFNPHGLEMFKAVAPSQKLKLMPMRWAARQQADHADRVVSLGGRLTDETERFLRVAPARIDVLPNAVDIGYIDQFTSEPRTDDRAHFVFVGRLEANKGVAILCEAFKDVPGARLSVVGSGPLEQELRARFQRANIEFLGRVDDRALFALYGRCDCFIFASLYEGMPTVILEAMARGLPVIATDIGAVRSMVDGKTGIVVQPNSVSALAVAIAEFLNTSAVRRREMAEAARRRVVEQFTWPRIARLTLDVIENNLRTRSARAP